MKLRISSPLQRFLTGAALVILLLAGAFIFLLTWLTRWGATAEEVNRLYPGDEIVKEPSLIWTHALTIQAPPEKVWPWIAQIGDVRGGYYSYTFIENAIAGSAMYHNANSILPEFQNPQAGDGLIADFLQVREVKSGEYLLAAANDSAGIDIGWTWLWIISPLEDGKTRLVVHHRIQPPPGYANPAIGALVNCTGFIMEKRMMLGIKERAEGSSIPGPIEAVEIIMWLAAFAAGVASAVLVVKRADWFLPLCIGVMAVIVLLMYTYLMPSLWLRGLIDILLFAGVWQSTRNPAPAVKKSGQGQ